MSFSSHMGNSTHVDDHADDHSGNQRPGHLPEELHLGLLLGSRVVREQMLLRNR